MKNLTNKNILVLGLGASGLALARWCVRIGAQVTVADTRAAPPQLQALKGSLPGVTFVHSPMDEALFASAAFDMVLKSPGLSPASVAPVINAAEARGTARGNELSLFARALADLKEERAYAPQVIGITGTNGKTTVTSLTGQLIARAGKSVAVAGNIGPTLLDTLTQQLDAPALPEVWVLELSSFQLDSVSSFEPTAAVVLNITQDHLDWHETFPAYMAAKARVYGSTGLMLLNRDDPLVMAALPPASPATKAKQQAPREYLTFGSDMPQRPGDYGIEVVNGMTWLVRAAVADETIKKRPHASLPPEGAVRALGRPGDAARKNEEVVLHIQRLMPMDALRIHGLHNATNALAALALAVAAGCNLAPMLHGLREYRGEPHRVESVAVIHDVEYFDDSKGTNVGATVAALAGLGTDRKLVVILGGEGKGQDFSPLADAVSRYARAVVLIGRDAARIRAAIEASGVQLFDAGSMQEAVAIAAQQARTGDAVLMSPACASFDMFDNYEHRAQVFCEAVQALAQDSQHAGVLV
jgi:UDP-N-acetylmuramoylalanine--D-glutamate ligase